MTLPIESALPELLAALQRRGRAVLQAPPGAGKTTMVPLAIDYVPVDGVLRADQVRVETRYGSAVAKRR